MIRNTILLFIFLATVFTSCSKNPSAKNLTGTVTFDLDSIKKRGNIIAITDYNSTDYFLYKGEPMGFNYELLKAFSDYAGIDLEIIPENHPDKALAMLKKGEADLLAYGLVADSVSDIDFSLPVAETRQVLVQKKPGNWRSLTESDLNSKLVRDLHDLKGKTVYVQAASSGAGRLISNSREIVGSVGIIEVPFESEKLIQHVSRGEIEYMVCDENVALVNSTYFANIDISTPVGKIQGLSWGIRKMNSNSLQAELNRWLAGYRKSGSYAQLYAKYFKNNRSVSMIRSDLYALKSGKVSEYDDMIRHFSASIRWDWRLLASLICQESHFDQTVESRRGAIGLMQIMPETAKNFGIDVSSSAENNMEAGVKYINWLHTIFDPKIPDEKERINFILAAYNAGPGHVLDAMKLAEKNGMDPQKWNGNVAVWLLKKSQPEYYNDVVVKNGYFKGVESVNFVSEVLERFEHYKNIIP